ncbi:transferase family protein [Moniliophthora roreri MCA 2997]|uniref:Transferase family protein n=2 Tax=Moniliophthora roreri TaxID=221103 RepID=V2WUB7_MONRO|nr:transferase family protein [Moniliophthora roreri MCA 2997]
MSSYSSAIPQQRSRIFPLRRKHDPITIPLSIIDATVMRYSPTGGIWLFEEPLNRRPGKTSEHLAFSLQKTLDIYPQLSGQLKVLSSYSLTPSHHNERFNRPHVTWGQQDDPGVELVIGRCPLRLSSILPDAKDRAHLHQIWDPTPINKIGLLPQTPNLALHDRVSYVDLPSTIMQITSFECGAIAIAVKMAHVLADAQTLLTFMHDWATVHRGIANGEEVVLTRPFEPQRLDAAAAGDIEGLGPDKDIMAQAESVPLHRYDWWASRTQECPPFMIESTEIPDAIKAHHDDIQFGKPLPWKQWDVLAPTCNRIIYFSQQEIFAMWEDTLNADQGLRTSKLDALLSHVWSLITRARQLQNNDVDVHFDVTIGLRNRIASPLPPDFLGSPILTIPVSLSAKELISGAKPAVASTIRSSMMSYNPSALGALLHRFAYDLDPARYWNTCLGERHTIVTSWLESRAGMGVYDLDFGFGRKPRMVDPNMPVCDGCVQIMETGILGDGKKSWHDDGAAISLHLRTDVMERLLADPLLRKYKT